MPDQPESDMVHDRIAAALAVCDRIEKSAAAWDPPHPHGEAWVSVTRQIRAALGPKPLSGCESYPNAACPEHGPRCGGSGCCCRDKHRVSTPPAGGERP